MAEELSFVVDVAGDVAVHDELAASKRNAADGTDRKKATDTVKRRKLNQKQRRAEREDALASFVFDQGEVGELQAEGAATLDAVGERAGDSHDEGVANDEEGGDGSDLSEGETAILEKGKKAAGRKGKQKPALRPAWRDADDRDVKVNVAKGDNKLKKLRKNEKERQLQGSQYEERLRQQFQSTQPAYSWASIPEPRRKRGAAKEASADAAADSDEAEAEADEAEEEAEAVLLRSAAAVLSKPTSLASAELSVKRMTDLNQQEKSASMAQAVSWHPNGALALTAGFDKTIRLFRVDGTTNAKLQSIYIARMPIASAAFSADGSQVVCCGRGRYWASVDLNSGKAQVLPGVLGRSEYGFDKVLPSPDGETISMISSSGALLLLSAKTKQLVSTLQSSGNSTWGCQAAAYSPDGSVLYASGQGGQVQVWDVRRRCCIHTFRERGGLRCCALAASADGRLVAAGADSGAVNLYETASLFQSSTPVAIKEFLNLRTAITELTFNPHSEMLCFASRYVQGSMRVAHVASKTVFPNWPTAKTPLNFVQSCAFSPHSGFLAIGNDKGRALLYRMNHYSRA